MFGKNTVRRQVMKVIADRINETQIACDAEVKGLREEMRNSINRAFDNMIDSISHAIRSFRLRKMEVESRHVNSILSKII